MLQLCDAAGRVDEQHAFVNIWRAAAVEDVAGSVAKLLAQCSGAVWIKFLILSMWRRVWRRCISPLDCQGQSASGACVSCARSASHEGEIANVVRLFPQEGVAVLILSEMTAGERLPIHR